MKDILYITGQALGIAAVITGFTAFQMKTPGKILLWQIITASIFSAHYILIGEAVASALNLLAAVQCVAYFFRDKKGSKSPVIPLIFTVLIIITGILTWDDWYSAFIVSGLAVNSIALAISNAQMIRIAMFVKSPLCLVYNAFAGSLGGIVFECAVLISSVIGIIRNKEDK